MKSPLIYLHEEALRSTHPVFKAVSLNAKAIYVWDDAYLKQMNYSFKRLVFIYETLCALPVEIIHGDTVEVIKALQPERIYIPFTNHPDITSHIKKINEIAPVRVIADEAFCQLHGVEGLQRFSQYWKRVEKSVFLKTGGGEA